MMFRPVELDGVKVGRVDLGFRRWDGRQVAPQ
jgi:hypothetical protein